jgi:F-type H+-transporting ATPase subunit epsilon
MYHLQVLTPENVIFDEMVTAIIAPGTDGYLGVLANHAPLITSLQPGILIITDQHKVKHYYKVTGGFLEVNHNEASLLVDEIEKTVPVNMSGGV